MANPGNQADEAAFLSGGGAMGALIAKHDWASTALGPLGAWPTSLKTATALILNSSLPMAILIGEDGVTIYNDPYATLIGRRHPKTLGSKAREWPSETAALSRQAIAAGLSGQKLSFRDLELTVYRSGAPEQAWMNIDCSPVPDENGRSLGVLSVVVETTARVVAERRAAVEIDRFRRTFDQAPGFICLMSGPDHIIEFVNQTHKVLFGDHNAVGKPYREAMADLATDRGVDLLDQVYTSGERFVGRAEPVRIAKPGGPSEERLLDLVIEPMTDDHGHITGLYAEGFDVTEQVRAQAVAAENERRLSAAVAVAQLGAFEWDLETGRATLDQRAREIFGFKPDEELMVVDVSGRIDRNDIPRVQAASRAAEASGQTRREFEYRIHLPDGAIRNIASVSDAMAGPDGRIRRIIGVFDDVTERRRAEKRQRMLINELNHRVKNTLATVQSIAAQTLRAAPDLARAREAFEARLVALAAAHDLLTAESWRGARLTDVVASAMAPFETERRQVDRSGPPVWLSAQRSLALSMALHELATNAIKYGALSTPEGKVTIRWELSPDDELTLSWVEQGGPPVGEPERSGFGSRLLQRNLAHELDGEVAFTFAPDGVRCTIRFELEDVPTSAEPASPFA